MCVKPFCPAAAFYSCGEELRDKKIETSESFDSDLGNVFTAVLCVEACPEDAIAY